MEGLKSVADTRKLSNGVEIPCVGYGTWKTPDGEETAVSYTHLIHPDHTAVYIVKPHQQIDLEHVDFSYSPETKLIEDLNLSVKPGQRIALSLIHI